MTFLGNADLTDEDVREILEATLRLTSVFAHVSWEHRKMRGMNDMRTYWPESYALVERADDWRGLILHRVLEQFDLCYSMPPLAEGRPCHVPDGSKPK